MWELAVGQRQILALHLVNYEGLLEKGGCGNNTRVP